MAEQRQVHFFGELRERRVPQLLGLYMGASWVALEFLGFITGRYDMSPYLVDLVLLALGCMLPSVLLLAYTHGKPGKDEWTFTEKVVIPVNTLLTIALAFAFFSGKDLGATTLLVTAEDETGQKIERVIPKAGYRKQVALFFFSNDTGDPAAGWVGHWLPWGLYLDLIQDLYFDNRNPYQMSGALIEAGAKTGDAPLALMREIARRYHLPNFLEGSVLSVDPYRIETRLYQTKGGRLLASHVYDDADLGHLLDGIAVDIKRDLGLSYEHLIEVEDLPVTALASDNTQALALFVEGLDQIYFQADWTAAVQALGNSTTLDSTFVHAQFLLYQATLFLGRPYEEAIHNTMQFIYKVPERLQGAIKKVYYLYQGEPEKALSALNLDVTLFPDDVVAHRRLASFYNRFGFYPEALDEYRLIRDLNPEDDLVLRDIAEVHTALGQFREALRSLHDYTKNNPRDAEVLVEMGAVYQLLGRVNDAAKLYDRALLLGYNSARVMFHQARLLSQLGEHQAALVKAQEALDAASTAETQLLALRTLEDLYESLGRIRESMAAARQAMPLERRVYGPMNSVLLRLSHFNKYARTTFADSAEQMLFQIDQLLPEPWSRALPVLRLEYKLAQGNRPVTAEEEIQVEDFFREYKFLDTPYELITARIHEMNSRFLPAIQGYITTLSHYPKRLMIQRDIARTYRKMGDAVGAMTMIDQLLEVYPHDPDVLFELYKIQVRINPDTARETLLRLGKIWENADRVFLPAQEVRAVLQALLSS
jgi:tetratricopeptide (TPR) repeat protein